ncbi:MAG TPA: hypothetical protein VJS15_04545 [Allosphingosinicella sp.]|nr:hypothetical protein [Allosphingosinicella sp.]
METESNVSRRNVLLVAGGMAAVGALAASPARTVIARGAQDLLASRAGTPRITSLATASYEQWLGQVGSVFSLGGGVRMQLSGVRAMSSTGARPASLARNRAFVAFFDPAGGSTLAGDLIYTITHAQHGPLQLFLSASPDARTPARMLAVFN